MGHPIVSIEPIGGMDFDNVDVKVGTAEGDYRFALNIRNSYAYENKESSATNLKGNILIQYDLHNVYHKCIGTVEDNTDKSVFYFLWAADDNHKILHYIPSSDATYGSVNLVATYNWQWQQDTLITSVDVVRGSKQGVMIYWTDNIKPRKINATKAEIANKFKTWTCYLPVNYTNFQTRFFFNINQVGTTQSIYTLTIDTRSQPQITSQALLLQYLANAINADSTLKTYVQASACDCSIDISEVQANKVNAFFIANDILTVPINWYGTVLTERMTDLCKYPPILPPVVNFGINNNKKYNNIKNTVFQFRLQYQYDDYEQSALGPISQVPINETANDGLQLDIYNYLHIDFNDTQFVQNIGLITRVAVFVKADANDNVGDWREVALLDICDLLQFSNGAMSGYYDFYNNTVSNSIDTALAAKEYDVVPIKNSAQRFVNNHLVMGGITENYDPVDCVDIEVKHDFDDGDDTYYYIYGQIRIFNYMMDMLSGNVLKTSPNTAPNIAQMLQPIYKYTPADPSNPLLYEKYPQWGGMTYDNNSGYHYSDKADYLDQLSPLGGWVAYSVGTDFYGVSTQVQLKKGTSGSFNAGIYLPTDGGGVINADNVSTIQSFLSEGYQNIDVIQKFKIKVKKGKHIIRLASHWCSFGDVLGKGAAYDLNNGRRYQTTSTNVRNINPVVGGVFTGYDFTKKEIEVEITNADVFIGEFVVEDCRSLQTVLSDVSVSGYLVDTSQTGSSANLVSQAPRIEGQIFEMVATGIDTGVVGTTYTSVIDHNGYFYRPIWNYEQDSPDIGGSFKFRFRIAYMAGTNYLYDTKTLVPFISNSILQDIDNAILSAASVDISTQVGGINFPDVKKAFQFLFCVSDAVAINSMSTTITGRFVDSQGNGISGATVIFGYCGRVVTTDVDGFYKLLVYSVVLGYSDLSTPHRLFSDLIIQYNGTTNNINNNPQAIQFTTMPATYTAAGYSLVANYDPFGKSLKRGGVYQIGYREYDAAGRVNTVMTNQKCIFTIPFITEDLHDYYPDQYPVGTYKYGKVKTTVKLNFKPSKFAVAYQILLSLNQYESDYLVWVANEITYVSNIGYSSAENAGANTILTTNTISGGSVVSSVSTTTPTSTYIRPVVSSYQAGDATNIYISLKNLVDFQRSNHDSVLAYSYQQGDRIRLISDANGIKYTQLYELDVTGYDSVLQSIIVRNSVSLPELSAGITFEVLHPKTTVEQDKMTFFEVGEAFLCTNPGNDNNDFTQNPIVLTCGDTYWRRRQYLVNDPAHYIFESTNYLIEDRGLSDFFNSKSWDIGRIGIADPYFKQQHFPTKLRLSNVFITGTQLNGLSSFEPLNDKDDISISNGEIRSLIVIGQVLIIICNNKNTSIYLGAILARDQGGQGIMQVTDSFFGNTRAFEAEYGSQNPESIRVWQGYAYGWDANQGLAWRYSSNGFHQTSDYNAKGFFNRYRGVEIWSSPCAFDKAYEEYIMTIYPTVETKIANTVYNPIKKELTINLSVPISSLGVVVGDIVGISGTRVRSGQYERVKGSVMSISGNTLVVSNTEITDGFINAVLYTKGDGVTISFSEPKNKWCTTYSFLPDYYGNFSKELISFKNGTLWIHDKDNTPAGANRFYGVKYPSLIRVIFNLFPKSIKTWWAIMIDQRQDNALFEWLCSNVTNIVGQQSNIPNRKFERWFQLWHAFFLRDVNTPHKIYPLIEGDLLQSTTLTVDIENPSNDKVSLREIRVMYSSSGGQIK